MLLSNSAFQTIFSYYAVHVCDAVALFISHSFFGEDPPLLAIFLKKLGYEVTKNTCFIFSRFVNFETPQEAVVDTRKGFFFIKQKMYAGCKIHFLYPRYRVHTYSSCVSSLVLNFLGGIDCRGPIPEIVNNFNTRASQNAACLRLARHGTQELQSSFLNPRPKKTTFQFQDEEVSTQKVLN